MSNLDKLCDDELNCRIAELLGWHQEIIGDYDEWIDSDGKMLGFTILPDWSTNNCDALETLIQECEKREWTWDVRRMETYHIKRKGLKFRVEIGNRSFARPFGDADELCLAIARAIGKALESEAK